MESGVDRNEASASDFLGNVPLISAPKSQLFFDQRSAPVQALLDCRLSHWSVENTDDFHPIDGRSARTQAPERSQLVPALDGGNEHRHWHPSLYKAICPGIE